MGSLRSGLAVLALLGGFIQTAWSSDHESHACDRTNWLGQREQPGADYAGSQAALLDLLAVVPNNQVGLGGAPMISYLDIDAMVAAGLHKVLPDASLDSAPLEDALRTLMRANAGPAAYLQYMYVGLDTMVGEIGVGPTDIRRGLDFGMPPALGMILGLDPSRSYQSAVADALTARDFGQREIDGLTIWHHLDDNTIDIANRTTGDPFWGHLGRSKRLFLFESMLAGTPAWSTTEMMVAAASGQAPSLVNSPEICAIAMAMTGPTLPGALLQFVLVNPADVMVAQPELAISESADEPGLDLVLPDSQPGDLPPYRLAAFADRFAGDRDEALIALAYRDAETAAAGAAVLADRMRNFLPASAPDHWQQLLADFNAEIASEIIEDPDDGPAIALVRIRYDSHFPTDETDDGLRQHGGLLFHHLMRAYFNRELTPLIVEMD